MTFDYASLRDNVVETQLAAFGQAATLTQPGTPTGDEWNPFPGTPVEYVVNVVKGGFNTQERSGTLVQENDVLFLLSTEDDPSPDLKGTLTVGGNTYQIVKMTTISPASTVVMWRVHCRK